MKPKSTKYKKIGILFLIILIGLACGSAWYLNSSKRAEIEHGIELPEFYSDLTTYGTGWQIWRNCGCNSRTFFVIPEAKFSKYISKFKILLKLPVFSRSTRDMPYLDEYLIDKGHDFRVTDCMYVHCRKEGYHQEIWKIENREKTVLAVYTHLTNPCD
jgi:hypothetical protein